MNRYSNGKIYKVVDIGYNSAYYGSTCEELCQRMARHRYKYNYYLKTNSNKISVFNLFDKYGIDNCKIEWVEDYPCKSKKELQAREGKYQKENDCVNKKIEGRTQQEYYQSKIDTIREYRNGRKEETQLYNKEYREKHKEYLAQQKKEYAIANKDKMRRKRSKATLCGCGVQFTGGHRLRHERTKKHQDWVKQQEPEEEPLQQSN